MRSLELKPAFLSSGFYHFRSNNFSPKLKAPKTTYHADEVVSDGWGGSMSKYASEVSHYKQSVFKSNFQTDPNWFTSTRGILCYGAVMYWLSVLGRLGGEGWVSRGCREEDKREPRIPRVSSKQPGKVWQFWQTSSWGGNLWGKKKDEICCVHEVQTKPKTSSVHSG